MLFATQKYKQVLWIAPNLDDYLLSILELYTLLAFSAEFCAIAVKYAKRVFGKTTKFNNVKTNLRQIIN
jgi:hypothetical protein